MASPEVPGHRAWSPEWLQTRAGNRTTSELLSRSVVVGAANDPAEREADRIADAAVGSGAFRVRRSASAAPGPIGLEGGALDEATSADLERQRGAGQGLPVPVAERFSAAMGGSFHDVRIHTDAAADTLSRKMSAQAFTVGRDVFFSKGAYQPDRPEGQHLLAHELAHVRQQRSGASRSVIRRAVGFEFETNLIVKKQVKNGGQKVMAPLAKMETIKSYPNGLEMEADENSSVGSTVEFVIKQVEEGDRRTLEKAMDKLETIAQGVTKHKFPSGGDLMALAADPPTKLSKMVGSVSRSDVWAVPTGNNFTSNPQVTGGIAMDKVLTMLSQIGSGSKNDKTPGGKAASALEKMSPDRPAELVQSVQGVAGSEEFKGLAAMLVGYLKFGAASSGPMLNYAKLISNSTLIRTDFGTWFGRLPDPDKKAMLDVSDNSGVRGQKFADTILQAAGLPGDKPVYERGVRTSYDKTSPDYNTPVRDPDLMISRQDWLVAITKGWDPLSSYWMPRLKGQLEGLGRLGPKMDQVRDEVGTNKAGSGVIMEFRNMAKDVPWNQWKPLALGIFDYIVSLNKTSGTDDDAT